VRLLLDTHALLWFLLDDPKLGRDARVLMTESTNELLVSPASYWEMAIKVSLGKYALGEDFEDFMRRQMTVNDLTVLPITLRHAAIVASLPFHHRDPFDRLLIAQAMAEQIPLLGCDEVFDQYPIARIW
jgi:PIN domain nuclease of toxin-antitoxin system